MTLEKSFIIEDRNKYINRIDILGKIKPLTSLLPDGESMTIKSAAKYYEVDRSVVERCLNRHKEEFEQDGLRTITKRDNEFELYVPALSVGQHTVKLVSRRALLRLGMLLTISTVAVLVRDYLSSLDDLIETEEAKKSKRERNRNHSVYYMEHIGGSKKEEPAAQTEEAVQGIHSNNDEVLSGLISQLEQFKVNTGLVNDMSLRIKELEYELNLKTILLEDQRKVVALTQKAINKLKRDNKELREDQKAIQRIVFKSMMSDELQSQCENNSYAYERETASGLVTKI